MHFVYLLVSLKNPEQHYVGNTKNLEDRLALHNAGNTIHTNRFKPWKLHAYIMVDSEQKAIELEKYLKSGSGREFIYKRLL